MLFSFWEMQDVALTKRKMNHFNVNLKGQGSDLPKRILPNMKHDIVNAPL